MRKGSAVVIVILVIVAVLAVVLGFFLVNRHNQTQAPQTSSSTSSSSSTTPTATSTVTIQNFDFSPSAITVKKGTTVTWINKDSSAHTVTADDKSFDSGTIAAGKSYTHSFDTVGTFAYHCSIHTSMKGSVIVTN